MWWIEPDLISRIGIAKIKTIPNPIWHTVTKLSETKVDVIILNLCKGRFQLLGATEAKKPVTIKNHANLLLP